VTRDWSHLTRSHWSIEWSIRLLQLAQLQGVVQHNMYVVYGVHVEQKIQFSTLYLVALASFKLKLFLCY